MIDCVFVLQNLMMWSSAGLWLILPIALSLKLFCQLITLPVLLPLGAVSSSVSSRYSTATFFLILV